MSTTTHPDTMSRAQLADEIREATRSMSDLATLNTYAAIGAWITAGASVDGALRLALRCIAEDVTGAEMFAAAKS